MRNHPIIALLLITLLPPLLAALALQQGWYTPGVRNQGQWLNSETPLLPPAHQPWRLVYLQPAQCKNACLAAPQLMARVRTALGRSADALTLLTLPGQTVNTELAPDDLVLVDANGLAIMRYPLPTDETSWPGVGKAVLADLRQLLKNQRSEG